MPPYTMDPNQRRNNITQALMNIQQPPPQTGMQMPAPGGGMGGPQAMAPPPPMSGMQMPQMPPPGAPPQGAPIPQQTPVNMPLGGGMPPQPPMPPGAPGAPGAPAPGGMPPRY